MLNKKEKNMVENLTRLYNTLLLIETKGENTKIMGQSLQFLENLILEERNRVLAAATKPSEEQE